MSVCICECDSGSLVDVKIDFDMMIDGGMDVGFPPLIRQSV